MDERFDLSVPCHTPVTLFSTDPCFLLLIVVSYRNQLQGVKMASILKRTSSAGETSYLVQVRLRGSPPQNATFQRLTDAKKWAASIESAIREGRHFKTSEAKRHTLADLFDRYVEQIAPRKKNARNDERHLQHFKKDIGRYLLSDVSSSLINEARDRLRDGKRADSTVNRYMVTLSHCFTVAVNEWEWLQENPCRKIRKLKEPRGRTRFLSRDEIDLLLEACRRKKSTDLYDAVVLSLSTGARQGEIWQLRWEQVDFARQVITLTETKNNEIRLLPLTGIAFESLAERSRFRRIESSYVFPQGKDPSKPIDLKDPWEAALKEAGITDFHWHDLRHTAASYLAMNGASLAEIAEVLGHKTLAMVKRYAHLSQAHTAKVVESMNKSMFKELKRVC